MPFNRWLASRALQGDVPSVSLALREAMCMVMPVGSRGSTRDRVKTIMVTSIHAALAVARLTLAYRAPRWASWFKAAWKTLQPSARLGITQGQVPWFLSVLQWIQVPMEATSAVYVLFGHAGLYIGKANLARTRVSAGWVPGLASRCVEHLVGLFIGKSRDASLPRYKVLRGSLASITFFPVAVFASEVRALHVEKILIQALQPSANGG